MQEKEKRPQSLIWMGEHYLLIIIILTAIYLLLAFSAPLLTKMGYTNIGKRIYLSFSSLCHQYVHRSWFLFGQQTVYPLEPGNGILSAYEAFNIPAEDHQLLRTTIGNDVYGYKIAICQRDVAIYGAFLLFSIVFMLSQRKITRISFSTWILLAVIPMAVDGTWQFLSNLDWMSFLNLSHESTPLLRSITGGMFGLFSGWFLFPLIENLK